MGPRAGRADGPPRVLVLLLLPLLPLLVLVDHGSGRRRVGTGSAEAARQTSAARCAGRRSAPFDSSAGRHFPLERLADRASHPIAARYCIAPSALAIVFRNTQDSGTINNKVHFLSLFLYIFPKQKLTTGPLFGVASVETPTDAARKDARTSGHSIVARNYDESITT